ncbi:MAG TPA: hypothetical protein VNC22_08500 [Sporichthya sp.]|nr:hypothetical protein [Sporichthya sp.]
MGQVVQLVGAVIVLAAFIANQQFGLSSDSVKFLLANAVGTSILAIVAGVNGDLGFLLLEGVWAVVSFLSLGRLLRGGSPAQA